MIKDSWQGSRKGPGGSIARSAEESKASINQTISALKNRVEKLSYLLREAQRLHVEIQRKLDQFGTPNSFFAHVINGKTIYRRNSWS